MRCVALDNAPPSDFNMTYMLEMGSMYNAIISIIINAQKVPTLILENISGMLLHLSTYASNLKFSSTELNLVDHFRATSAAQELGEKTTREQHVAISGCDPSY